MIRKKGETLMKSMQFTSILNFKDVAEKAIRIPYKISERMYDGNVELR